MTPEDLDAIHARLDAATPGPWAADQGASGNWWIEQRNRSDVADMHPENANSAADAELIAHAPADLAALLDEVERLTAEREKWSGGFGPEVLDDVHGTVAGLMAERDAARAALESFRADVEELTDPNYGFDGEPLPDWVSLDDLAALLAKHAGEDA